MSIRRGFTLVELLVVDGLPRALVVGVNGAARELQALDRQGRRRGGLDLVARDLGQHLPLELVVVADGAAPLHGAEGRDRLGGEEKGFDERGLSRAGVTDGPMLLED